MSEERLTWAQIQKKYPHMYVGLDDVEYEEDDRVKSAVVKYAGEKEPEPQYHCDDVFGFLHSDLVVRYTTLDEDDPLGYLNPNTVKSGGERLTWKEIVRRYPHQNVGLVEIEYGCNEATVASAVVKCTDRDTDPDDMAIMALRGEILMEYTTYDEDFPLEFFQEEPDTLAKRKPEPYEMERWRTEQKLNAVFDFLGRTGEAIDEICDMTDGFPWFWQEPLLHQYVEQHPSKHLEKLRKAFQRAEEGAILLFEAKRKDYDVEIHLHPPISDWKSFFQSADAWKETLQGLPPKAIITLWNYYLIEAVYAFDFQRKKPCGYVFASANESDATWTIWDDEKMERIPQRGKLEDAVMSAVDRRALSGYLAMRALDLETILKLAQDAAKKFEEELPRLE